MTESIEVLSISLRVEGNRPVLYVRHGAHSKCIFPDGWVAAGLAAKAAEDEWKKLEVVSQAAEHAASCAMSGDPSACGCQAARTACS